MTNRQLETWSIASFIAMVLLILAASCEVQAQSLPEWAEPQNNKQTHQEKPERTMRESESNYSSTNDSFNYIPHSNKNGNGNAFRRWCIFPRWCAFRKYCRNNPDSEECTKVCERNPNRKWCKGVPKVPIGGLGWLLVSGVGYGIYKLRE